MMKLIRMIGRNVRDALKSIIRNFSLSAASIFSITITLLLVATSVIMSANVDNFTKFIGTGITATYLVDTIGAQRINITSSTTTNPKRLFMIKAKKVIT